MCDTKYCNLKIKLQISPCYTSEMPKLQVDRRGYSSKFFTGGGIAWFFKKVKNAFLGVKIA